MNRVPLAAFCALASIVPAHGADPQPDPEVFVADLDLATGKVGAPRNVSERVGYDNQPAFLTDGSGLLYVAGDAEGGSDVWRYDFATGEKRQVTHTAEAEYSPTPLPDGKSFSAIRVGSPQAKDEAYTESQQLYRYSLDGAAIAPVNAAWTRVGYHRWLDEGRVAMFLVGGGEAKAPHRLVIGKVADGSLTDVAKDPGRSLGRAPDGALTWVDQSAKDWRVMAWRGGEAVVVTPTPVVAGEEEHARSQDMVWLPDGTLLMAHGDSLLRFDPKQPQAGWATLHRFEDLGGDIKRLAVSRDGKRVAMVVEVAPVRTRGIRG